MNKTNKIFAFLIIFSIFCLFCHFVIVDYYFPSRFENFTLSYLITIIYLLLIQTIIMFYNFQKRKREVG